MTTPIPPALTPALNPEEWEWLETTPFAGHIIGLTLRQRVKGWTYGLNDTESLAAIVALANAALPADSPYRLTWAQVDMLTHEGEMIGTGGLGRGEKPDSYYDRPHQSQAQREAAMRALASLIASLLPPRG